MESIMSVQFATMNDNETIQTMNTATRDVQTVALNVSHPDGCVEVIFSQMAYLPWDNLDNVVSAETEKTTKRIKDTMLFFLFLIGGPGNVINMAVFYKQGLKDRVNLCLFALALADELYLITGMFYHAEQMHIQFTTKERFGPIFTFMINHYLTGFGGFCFVSNVLSAIIAIERCVCVLNPLKFQILMRTRTMAAVIIVVYVVVVGMFFIVAFRYHVACVYDPETGAVLKTTIDGEWYINHKTLVNAVDGVFFGAGFPMVMVIVVTVTTVVTTVKLGQIVAWRAQTTSSSSSSSSSLSAQEVGLTKILVVISILFIVCVFPVAFTRLFWLFLPEINSARRNHNFFLMSQWIIEMFSFVNSTFNIFVYYAMGSRYRETFWALCGRKPHPGKQ